jgi:hypothetical protein
LELYNISDSSNNGDQSYFTTSAPNAFAGMNTVAVGDDFVKQPKQQFRL